MIKILLHVRFHRSDGELDNSKFYILEQVQIESIDCFGIFLLNKILNIFAIEKMMLSPLSASNTIISIGNETENAIAKIGLPM